MQDLLIERTAEAVIIRLPLDTSAIDIQNMSNYFKYVKIGSSSQVTDDQIAELAQDAKASWWQSNKSRFLGQEGFEGLE